MSSLVAYYGSSDEDDENDMDIEASSSSTSAYSAAGMPPSKIFAVSKPNSSPAAVRVDSQIQDDHFEESLIHLDSDVLDGNADIFNSSSALKLDKYLPKPKAPVRLKTEDKNIIEEGPIPPKKIYGDEEQPKASTFHNISTKKSAKGIIQISIPSLKSFVDEEENSQKRTIVQGLQKVSGLFALLPQPKNDVIFRIASNSSEANPAKPISPIFGSHSLPTESAAVKKSVPLIPQAVQQGLAGKRLAPNERLAQIRAKYLKQESNFRIVSRSASKTKSIHPDEDDSDEERSHPDDFFSLDSNANNNFDATNNESPQIQSSVGINLNPDVEEYVDPNLMDIMEEPLPTPFENQVQIEQPDLMKYIQPTKKGRGKVTAINIIDVNADDLRPATNDWLKTITDTSMIPPRKAVLPGGMTKRKHQITYLAAEAKSREEELQNQWAQNRQARRQTQNKYGF